MHAPRVCLAAVLFTTVTFAAPTGATSANTDLSDIWWNPAEDGWGMQMVNTGTFVFATVYVYGPNGTPTWFTGQLEKTGAAQTTYAGPLYATTGPYFGGPFNPAAVTARQVGSMSFALTAVSTGQLNYTVDGVPVSKLVQRQTLTFDNYAGDYDVITTQTTTGCANAIDNGTSSGTSALDVSQNGQFMTLVNTYRDNSSCSYSGTYSQRGRLGQVSGTYACTWGEVGTMTIFEMSNVPYMFTARMQSNSSNFGCNTEAEIAGLIPR